ncbi:flavodoxin [Halanaerobium kushneri]|uniref:Flavodoxin n=1 Tax=Halanaerobium kushneri TaxID=56779 RepID=A0A1N6WRK4_9FIRM|nr:flavodoxin [Halanaerobium kushneri]SIQ92700.1 Flavodoxin [Halanaerobium kushneri]
MRLLAQHIEEETGGDVFKIVVEDLYSSNYDICLERAADELADNARPELSNNLDSIADYDIIFLGYPNWWSTLPMPVLTFLDNHDFSDKIVVPFCTHGTGGIGRSIRDLNRILSEADIREEFNVYRPYVETARPDLLQWLKDLNINY